MSSTPQHHGRRFRLTLITALVLGLCTAAPAFAVSVHDLVELSKAGLSDDVLVALIETDNTQFSLDAPKILELRAAGISERVITAMIKSGRVAEEAQPEPPPVDQAPIPAPSMTEQQPPPPQPTTVLIVPWAPIFAGPIVQPPGGHHRLQPTIPARYRGFGRFINDGWVDQTPQKPRR